MTEQVKSVGRVIDVVVKSYSQVRNGPGAHGSVIGYAGAGLRLHVMVDHPESPHDGWVWIVGPKPSPVREDGTWLGSGKVGWIEFTHVDPAEEGYREFKVRVYDDPSVPPVIVEI